MGRIQILASTNREDKTLSRNYVLLSSYSDEWLTDFKFVAGFLVFCIGFTINITADSTLLALKGKSVGNKVYSIPYGGIFEYVSCANYCEYNIISVAIFLKTFSDLLNHYILFILLILIQRKI